jgi:trypsin-like peptidase
MGSGVVLGGGRLAVTCHVTRDAWRIEVIQGDRVLVADSQTGSINHDLCVLTVRGLDISPVAIRHSVTLRPGQRVFAAGFPDGGDLVVTEGIVSGLHRSEGAWVIQTTAPFTFGASGGALFDEAGQLAGILAFKARVGGGLNFALPADWLLPASQVARRFAPLQEQSRAQAFWELPKDSQPGFLRAALLEAAGNLDVLAEWADRRLAREPSDVGGWIAAGKAAAGTGNRTRALAAFSEAMRLEPDHPAAGYYMQAVRARP